MGRFRQTVLLLYLQALFVMISANCIITKDSKKHTENYRECSNYYVCPLRTTTIEEGPIIYLCLNTDIAEMHKQLRRNIENIMFVQDANISSLPPNGYDWTNLTYLNMKNTNTMQIVPGFFNKFDQLKVLVITNNQLEVIVDGVFSSLTALTKLNLSDNSIKALTEHSFSGLLNLEILDLSKNKISSISSHVFNFQLYLEYVDMSQNILADTNNAFNRLSNAQMIKLSKNKLKAFDFKQLENYDMSIIDLSENNIENITGLNSVCIKTLSLAYNEIRELEGTKCIVHLDISNNKLQNIYGSKFEKNLELLDVSNNQISDLRVNAFENATGLRHLNIGDNKLEALPRNIFVNQNVLKKLNISNNNIKQLQFGLFNSLSNLTILDVSDNNMVLDFNVLLTLTHLEELHFENNNVKNFDPEKFLTRLKYLKYISLTDNLWNCSELADTIHLLQLKGVHFLKRENTNANNIFGISCKDNAELKEEVIQLKLEERNSYYESPNSINNLVDFGQDEINVNKHDEIDALNSINKTLLSLFETFNALVNAQNKSQTLPVISEDNHYNIYIGSLIICNLLLLLILCCIILYYLYYHIRDQKYYRIRFQDQIHMI